MRFKEYINLTKPTIILLVAITAFATMCAEGSLFLEPARMSIVLLAIILAAGSANSINQFIDRDIDSIMPRTKARRPLPLEQLTPKRAITFAVMLGVISTGMLIYFGNATAALISVLTILFYVFVYTAWLKRRHHYNIVIGGAAGATAPLIASAAYFGEPSHYSWILFFIIFMWTPPHFWALALALKEEYAAVKVPMLPNVLGDKRTRLEIFIYTLSLLPIGLLPWLNGTNGRLYAGLSILLWLWYFLETLRDLKKKTKKSSKKLFAVSILYLFLLFLASGLDGAIRFWGRL